MVSVKPDEEWLRQFAAEFTAVTGLGGETVLKGLRAVLFGGAATAMVSEYLRRVPGRFRVIEQWPFAPGFSAGKSRGLSAGEAAGLLNLLLAPIEAEVGEGS